jgi:hypothetical protein
VKRREKGRGGMHLHRHVLRRDGSLRRYKADVVAAPLLGTADEVRTKKCQCSRLHVGHTASHGLAGAPAHPVGRVWIWCAGEKNVTSDEGAAGRNFLCGAPK